jgi:hypothetical protein
MRVSAMIALTALSTCGMLRAAEAQPETGQPGVWVPHNLIVSLRGLPRPYSCDELWYKFHDVLLAIGARPTMRILAYRCDSSPGDRSRSPAVELKFEFPDKVHGPEARWATVSVGTKAVQIGPGQPPSIDSGDCELVKQMTENLLESLPVQIVASDLVCSGPRQRVHSRFGVTARVLTPVETGRRRAAVVGGGQNEGAIPTTLAQGGTQ